MRSSAALEDSVPENALLSHDLFEGLHARVALVSDVELVDDYPSSVLSHARRQHRWVRGDWQILFWLFPFVPSRSGSSGTRCRSSDAGRFWTTCAAGLVAPMPAGNAGLPGWIGAPWSSLDLGRSAAVGVAAITLLPVVGRLVIGRVARSPIPVFLNTCVTTPPPRWRRFSSA
jgi:cyclic beta-1,2-glucan synthetase